MKHFLLLTFLSIAGLLGKKEAMAQCPAGSILKSTGNCLGSTLDAANGSTLLKIVWNKDGTPVSTVTTVPSGGVTVAGGNGQGAAANQFYSTDEVFVDANGNLYVADNNNARIQKFPPGSTGATAGITVAGGNGQGASANQFNQPAGIFVDGNGNIYVADAGNNRIQKWTPGATSGITVAGGNGAGAAANQLNVPGSIYVDASGNMYISDEYNGRVQKWAPGATSGITVAGGNGSGSAANQFNGHIGGASVDGSGNVYVADFGNNRIQKWAPGAVAGVTVAGGNGAGPAANQLSQPTNVYVDGSGNVYVADAGNNRIQKWAPGATSGITVAGGNGAGAAGNQLAFPYGVFVDGNENVYVADWSNYRVQEWAASAAINTTYTPTVPGTYTAVITDAAGCTITTSSVIIYPTVTPSIAISASPPALCAVNSTLTFTANAVNAGNAPSYQWEVNGVKVGINSAVYTSNTLVNGDVVTCILTSNAPCATTPTAVSNAIPLKADILPAVSLSSTGNCLGATLNVDNGSSLSQIVWKKEGTAVNTIAATVTPGSGTTVAGGNGRGSAANQFDAPQDLWVDAGGNIYVLEQNNVRVQKWAPGATSGVTVAGGNGKGAAANQFNGPTNIFMDGSGNIYIADAYNNRIQEWTPGAVTGITVAGGNGMGAAANQFNGPTGVYVDGNKNVYVADQVNNRIQKWAPGATSGITVAGGNGVGAAANQFYSPSALFLDASGNLYVDDVSNNRIQKWAPGAVAGVTVAGGNGLGAAANQLVSPFGIYVDAVGNVYVADLGNERVQKWPPGATTGITVAGGNGFGSAANQLAAPTGVYVDAAGNIYIADNANNRIQEWTEQSSINTTYTPVAAGVYTATVSNSSGCSVTTNAITIDPTGSPSVSILGSATTICSGAPATFTATPVNGGSNPAYQWQVNGVNTGANSPVYTDGNLSNGAVVTCMITSNALCSTNPTAVSNAVTMTVNTSLTPEVSIMASPNPACSGDLVHFTGEITGGGSMPNYQWLANGVNAGGNSLAYSSDQFTDGDKISLSLSSNAGCANGVSDPVILTVNPSPRIDPGPAINLTRGQSVELDPGITGNIATYLWSPATGLSDSTIPNPLASPVKSIDYTLKVVTAEGCKAIGDIKVNVHSLLRIPDAFTPNGDGRNDVFYIMGGPQGSRINDFAVFNRWGQKIFQVHDVLPDDPATGWNGNYKGAPVSPGTYVYMVTMGFADGTQEIFKGTVVLIR